MKKLIVDDTYGWIVPIGDADSLANALENAYEKWLNGELEAMEIVYILTHLLTSR